MKLIRNLTLSIALLLPLAGCSSGARNDSQFACSQQTFPDFLDRFSSDIRFQEQSTEYPLSKMRIVDGDPEPKPQTTRLSKGEVVFPVMPDKNEREAKGLLLEPREVSPDRAKAQLHKPDTDYQVTYLFENKGCWKLREIQDWSL